MNTYVPLMLTTIVTLSTIIYTICSIQLWRTTQTVAEISRQAAPTIRPPRRSLHPRGDGPGYVAARIGMVDPAFRHVARPLPSPDILSTRDTLLSKKSSKRGLTRRPLFLVRVESLVCTVEAIGPSHLAGAGRDALPRVRRCMSRRFFLLFLPTRSYRSGGSFPLA